MKIIITACCLLLSCSGLSDLSGQAEAVPLQFMPGNHEYFDAASATMEYLSMLAPEQKVNSDAYFEGGYRIKLFAFIIEIVIAWIFLFLGLSKGIKRITSGIKKLNIRNLVYILLYLFFSFLIAFPFTVYADFVREHRFGLSNMTFSQWLSDEMILTALILFFGSLLILILYMVIRKSANRWWIWGSGIVIVFMTFILFIAPVFIAPLFNKYTELEESVLKEDILSLARANGVPVTNVYQFNASKQSDRISANVNGIGRTIRISLNDNLLKRCSPAEIKAVMAHELGHYVLNHMYKLVVYFSVYIFAGFALISFLMNKAIKRFGIRWSIDTLSDIGSLPMFVLIFSFYIFITMPVINNISRTTESEADIFGLNAAGEPDGFASVTMKLSEYRKIDPSRLEEIIFYDHPGGKTRILMAMKWKAEHLNRVGSGI